MTQQHFATQIGKEWYVLDKKAPTEGVFDKKYFNTYDNKIWTYRPSPCPLPYWGNLETLREILFSSDSSLGVPTFIVKHESLISANELVEQESHAKLHSAHNHGQLISTYVCGAIEGFALSKSKYPFSEEDMRKAIAEARMSGQGITSKSDDEILSELSRKVLIVEMDGYIPISGYVNSYRPKVNPKNQLIDKENNLIGIVI